MNTTTPGRPASTRQRQSAADAYRNHGPAETPLDEIISRLWRQANPVREKDWQATLLERNAAAVKGGAA
jgi:hypothetical protein